MFFVLYYGYDIMDMWHGPVISHSRRIRTQLLRLLEIEPN